MEKQANYALICVAFFLICFFAPSSGLQQTNCTYKITVKTANEVNAGTTSKVGLNMCYRQGGCFGIVPDLAVHGDNGANYTYFATGSVDNFTLTPHACLRPCLIDLILQSRGNFPDWIVQEVQILTIYSGYVIGRHPFEVNELLYPNTTYTYGQCPTIKFQPDNLELFAEEA